MNPVLGQLAIGAALIASAATFAVCILARRRRDEASLDHARGLLGVTAGLFLIATGVLLVALWRLDLRLAYVASHTDETLSPAFRLAALWSGQEGSLLLWALLTSVVGALAARVRRGPAEAAPVLATLSIVNGFFASLLLVGADPFARAAGPVVMGQGLNPQLQHWAMIIHPPLLFAGYACFTVPLAVMVGGLQAGDAWPDWPALARRWAVIAWSLLTAGIVLGGWWAYLELGWGGYWAWDPVENASLVPWLTGTALLHSLAVHQHRGVLKTWTACLAAATFILCLTGTYITRSGVIESVHAFGRSTVGDYFLVFMLVLTGASLAVILRGRARLRPARPIGSVLSREGMVLLTNIILVAMAGATLIGTLFPVISGVAATTPISVGAAYYNRVVAPLGVAVALIMAFAPAFTAGPGPAALRAMAGPAVCGGVAAAVVAAAGPREPVFLACVGALVAGLASVAVAVASAVRSFAAHTGFGLASSLARVLDANHRRYGGQLAHVGLGLLVVGVAGSSLLSREVTATLRPGETMSIGEHRLRFDALRDVRGGGYNAAEAVLVLDADGPAPSMMLPQRRFYDRFPDAVAEVAIRSSWSRDLYVALIGWEAAGRSVAIQARLNPLVIWIWTGAGLMVAGGLFAAAPRLLPRPRAEALHQTTAQARAVRAEALTASHS